MLARFFFTTVSGSILLGSMIISASILVGGNFKVKSSAALENEGAAIKAAQLPTQPSRAPQVQQAVQQPSPGTPVTVDIADSPVLGKDNVKLTLVEFSDYECPYCKKSFEELLPELKKNYIDTGKIKLVFKNLPLSFHKNAAKEAEAALCAKDQGGDIAYYKYHDQIFAKTTSGGTGITLEQLPVLAKEVGINVGKFQTCLDTSKYKSQVDKDIAEAGKVGVTGTPAWFLGSVSPSGTFTGTLIMGAQPYSVFKQVIDQQLAQS